MYVFLSKPTRTTSTNRINIRVEVLQVVVHSTVTIWPYHDQQTAAGLMVVSRNSVVTHVVECTYLYFAILQRGITWYVIRQLPY